MSDKKFDPSRRDTLKKGLAIGAVSALPTFYINHAWSKDAQYQGEVFDAGGATLNIGEWGGGWEEFVRAGLTDQFEKDFNCKINWDSAFPWFPKFVTQGEKDPVYDIANWNLPNLTQTKQVTITSYRWMKSSKMSLMHGIAGNLRLQVVRG